MVDIEDEARRLTGFMLHHNAGRIRPEANDGRALVWFHFEH